MTGRERLTIVARTHGWTETTPRHFDPHHYSVYARDTETVRVRLSTTGRIVKGFYSRTDSDDSDATEGQHQLRQIETWLTRKNADGLRVAGGAQQ